MEPLAGRVAVVTGAASGIGFAVAQLAARRGMRVALADISEARLDDARKALEAESFDVLSVPTDVADFASVRRLAETVLDEWGAVHLVHLNAGIAARGSLLDHETGDWERVIDINLKGVVWGIKAFVPRMLELGDDGYVLATSSGSGAEGTQFGVPDYAASKIAVVSVMESLYGQLRELGSRVKTGVLFPPLTATNIAGDKAAMQWVETHLRSTGIPATMVGPDEVAAMVLDGVQRGRFFIRPGGRERTLFFGGKLTQDWAAWNARMITGRGLAVLADGRPDDYLW